jgi:hypothetical protein
MDIIFEEHLAEIERCFKALGVVRPAPRAHQPPRMPAHVARNAGQFPTHRRLARPLRARVLTVTPMYPDASRVPLPRASLALAQPEQLRVEQWVHKMRAMPSGSANSDSCMIRTRPVAALACVLAHLYPSLPDSAASARHVASPTGGDHACFLAHLYPSLLPDSAASARHVASPTGGDHACFLALLYSFTPACALVALSRAQATSTPASCTTACAQGA